MSNRFRAYRQLERFLFKGVPEHPEPIYEREVNSSVADRRTGQALSSDADLEVTEEDLLIATITYDYEKKQVTVHRHDKK